MAFRAGNGKVVTVNKGTDFYEVSWDGFDKEVLDFDVFERPLNSNGIEIPDRKAIFKYNTETKEENYLATVSHGYNIIKHTDIIEKIEEGMNFGDNVDVDTIASANGAKMHRMYTLKDQVIDVGNGDEISPSIRIVNSYDGSTAVGFYIDAVRLVCVNGMISTRQFMSMSYKHFGKNFNLDMFASNAKKLIGGFKKYSQNWTAWTKEPVELERAKLLLNYMPVRFRPYVEMRFDNNWNGTKWGLYNAYTEAITHDYVPSRSLTPDTQRIKLSSEVTEMFAKSWYWNADENLIKRDLVKKNRIRSEVEEV